MAYFLNGLGMGLALSILVGPLLFALVQTSLEKGARAGLAVGAGIWISDLLFIAATYWGLAWVREATRWEAFEETLGTAGGLFLIGMGLTAILRQAPGAESRPVMGHLWGVLGNSWLKGFLVNTINPFTVFFWTSVATGILAEGEAAGWWFYLGVMLVIVLTDSAKVIGAKAIRPHLKPRNLLLVRRISGAAIALFGIGLIGRVWLAA